MPSGILGSSGDHLPKRAQSERRAAVGELAGGGGEEKRDCSSAASSITAFFLSLLFFYELGYESFKGLSSRHY